MTHEGDPTAFQENYKGVEIYYHRFDDYYTFLYEGVDHRRGTLELTHELIDFLIEETRERERREREEEEAAIIEIPFEEPELLEEIEEVVTEPIPLVELFPVHETSSLPWYAGWIEPIIKYIGDLTEGVVNYISPFFEPLKDIGSNIVALPVAIINAFMTQIENILQRGRDKGASLSVETMGQALEGTPAWMQTLQAQLDIIIEPILKEYNEAIDPEKYEESPITGARAVEALEEMRSKVLGAAIVNFTLHALVESGSFGQFEFLKELDTMISQKFGTSALIERATMLPVEKAILIPAEQEINSRYPNLIPTYTDLINMVVKEVIPLDRFRDEMLKLGFDNEWSQFIWDAHFKPPDWGQLLQAFYRGEITREQLDTFKVLVDLDPRYDVVWNSLIEVIPPYSELVNQLVKEVIDLPTFTKYMKWYGFSEEWAQRIWDAHFMPPALGDMVTAWRRDIITEDRLDELMIIADLDPRFKDIFDTRKYVDPTIRQGRYMFEAGAINRDRLTQIVARQGFLPEDIEPMTQYLATFQERLFKYSYLRALATGAVYEAYTEDELRAAVTEAGLSPEVADWMLRTAEVRRATTEARVRAPKPKLLSVSNMKKAYIDDIIEEDDLRTNLMLMGYESGDIDIMIQLLNTEKVTTEAGGRKLSLSQAELMNAWRQGVITEDNFKTELLLRGLPENEADTLIEAKKRQWGFEE